MKANFKYVLFILIFKTKALLLGPFRLDLFFSYYSDLCTTICSKVFSNATTTLVKDLKKVLDLL